jgi:hypothetical protein
MSESQLFLCRIVATLRCSAPSDASCRGATGDMSHAILIDQWSHPAGMSDSVSVKNATRLVRNVNAEKEDRQQAW